jgi:two-component system CheB/CheR fusion protein
MNRRGAVLKEAVRRHKEGRLVPVEITLSPIFVGTEKVAGISVIIRDISERRRAEEVQARLAAIVTSSADAIISEALDGTITSWNEAAQRMFGCSAGEMIGHSIRRFIPADRQWEEDAILAQIGRGESIDRHETTHSPETEGHSMRR